MEPAFKAGAVAVVVAAVATVALRALAGVLLVAEARVTADDVFFLDVPLSLFSAATLAVGAALLFTVD